MVFYAPSATALLRRDEPSAAGGAETQVLMLARELAARGHAVAIIAFGEPGNLRADVDGVEVIEHPRPTTRVVLVRTLAFYWHAFATLRANRTRVLVQRAAGVHTAVAALSACVLGSRFVYASAGVHDFDLRRWTRKRWIVRSFELAVKLADTVVVQTPEQAELCRRTFARNPTVIKSIAEPAPEQRSPPEAFLWIGSLIEYKRPLAFVELARSLPEARFWMVGVPQAGPEGRELAAVLTAATNALPNLDLLAPRPRGQLGPLIDRAVAIVSTSRTEGMPNVFLEGWSRGVPALALAHDPDGVLEREGVGSFAHGSSERMVSLARTLWESRAERAEQTARCRAYVSREHCAERIADEWAKALAL